MRRLTVTDNTNLPAESPRVLLIEDEPTVALAVSRVLERIGCSVVSVGNAQDGHVQLDQERGFDLLILDYCLQDSLCWPILERSQRLPLPIPAIILTGVGDETIASEALRLGAADYLIKRGDYLRELPRSVERVLAFARVKKDLQRLAGVVKQTKDLILVTDSQGTIEYVNPAFEAIHQVRLSDIRGRSVGILRTSGFGDQLYLDLWVCMEECRAWTGRLMHVLPGGESLHFNSKVDPICDESGRVTNMVLIQRDVSLQVHLEQQLMQTQKLEAIRRLAGGIAHDFNNLLTVITGSATFLRGELGGQEHLQNDLDEIFRASELAASLTRQLLSFARLQVFHPRLMSVNEHLLRFKSSLRRLLKEGIELEMDLGSAVGWVEADPVLLEQALLQLATNSSEAMPEGGTITIRTRQISVSEAHPELSPGFYSMIEVEDSGFGIPPEHLPEIFDPFFTTKPEGHGTGLGLSSVYGTAKQHGGKVQIESRVGVGTVVRLYFPESQTSRELDEAKEVSMVRDSRSRGSVLVVEDNLGVQRLVVRLLEKEGFLVSAFSEAESVLALPQVELHKFDLLLSDIILPGMVGPDMVRSLKQQGFPAPVIFMSGYSEPADFEDALSLGVAYVKKPFSIKELLEVVKEVLS